MRNMSHEELAEKLGWRVVKKYALGDVLAIYYDEEETARTFGEAKAAYRKRFGIGVE